MDGSMTWPFRVAFDILYTASTIEHVAKMDASENTMPGHLLCVCQYCIRVMSRTALVALAKGDLPPPKPKAKVTRVAFGLLAFRLNKTVGVEGCWVSVGLRVMQEFPCAKCVGGE